MNKGKVLETLEQLPNEFSTEELIDRLLFAEKVERGMQDVEEGKTLSLDSAREQFRTKSIDTNKHCGVIKLKDDPLVIQKRMRDEWN
ncbi:MAG: hypothetical protein ABJ004_18945 [Cyclobacteriaceae bacterium]